ncbi:MAG: septum formation initiator family protein [Ignavibacteriaceae bacterium]
MSKNKKKRFFSYFILALFLIGLLYLTFNEHGLIKYLKLEKEVTTLNNEIIRLQNENNSLKSEIDSLKKEIPAKIEQIAREKYDMIKEGETTIEVKEVEKDETSPVDSGLVPSDLNKELKSDEQ